MCNTANRSFSASRANINISTTQPPFQFECCSVRLIFKTGFKTFRCVKWCAHVKIASEIESSHPFCDTSLFPSPQTGQMCRQHNCWTEACLQKTKTNKQTKKHYSIGTRIISVCHCNEASSVTMLLADSVDEWPVWLIDWIVISGLTLWTRTTVTVYW